jgi:poly(3-hydroxybutyrate) depolymerase
MNIRSLFFILAASLLLSQSIYASDKVIKDKITSQNKTRNFYLFVPESVKPDTPSPMIVLLHGSGRNGLTLVDKWKDLAAKEGVILVGPDSFDSVKWAAPVDGPDFLHDLVENLKSKYPVDPRRVYLFGHSGGAVFTLYMSLFESQYFAAAAAHAGALHRQDPAINLAKRKTPIAMFVGTRDPLFPLDDVRATRTDLTKEGFTVELTEIPGHDHNYYDLSAKINQQVWDFLKNKSLSADPLYEQYRW